MSAIIIVEDVPVAAITGGVRRLMHRNLIQDDVSCSSRRDYGGREAGEELLPLLGGGPGSVAAITGGGGRVLEYFCPCSSQSGSSRRDYGGREAALGNHGLRRPA